MPDASPHALEDVTLAASVRRVLDRAHLRTLRWFTATIGLSAVLVVVLLGIAYAAGGHLPPNAGLLAASSLSLAVVVVLAVVFAGRPSFPVWVLAIAAHWIFFVLFAHGRTPRAWPFAPELSVGFALVWTGMLASPWVVAAASAVAVGCSVLLQIDWTIAPVHAAGERLAALPVVAFALTALFVSMRIGFYERHIKGPIESAIAELENRRRMLEATLETRERTIERTVDRLLDAQKLDLERAISRKLAHELNNALTPLRGSAELLLRADDPEAREHYARRILRASQMAAKLAESLLAYTRQGLFTPVHTDLGRFIGREVLPALAEDLPPTIRVESEVEPQIYARVDRSLLRHLLEQLLRNAEQASGEGGTIHVAVRRRPDPATGAPCAEILVRDEGIGMTTEVARRAFEPFYSTKGPGEGHGLGLAMVEGIAARHGGHVELSSTPDVGTTVSVFLPLERTPQAEPPWEIETAARPQLVLVSEDPDVRDVVADIAAGLPVDRVTMTDPEQLAERCALLPTLAVVVDRHHPKAATAVEVARNMGIPAFTTDADTRSSADVETGLAAPHIPLDPAEFASVLGRLAPRPAPPPPESTDDVLGGSLE